MHEFLELILSKRLFIVIFFLQTHIIHFIVIIFIVKVVVVRFQSFISINWLLDYFTMFKLYPIFLLYSLRTNHHTINYNFSYGSPFSWPMLSTIPTGKRPVLGSA